MINFDLAYRANVIVFGPPGSGAEFEKAHREAILKDLQSADPDQLAAVVEQYRKDAIDAMSRHASPAG